jgi:hypothetical protein
MSRSSALLLPEVFLTSSDAGPPSTGAVGASAADAWHNAEGGHLEVDVGERLLQVGAQDGPRTQVDID